MKRLIILMAACLIAFAAGYAPLGRAEKEPGHQHSDAFLRVRAQALKAEALDWDYSDPKGWPAEFSGCGGTRQSPVSVRDSLVLGDPITPYEVHYDASKFLVYNNGHTIEAEDLKEKSHITVRGVEYELLQFHFHSPSEERVAGSRAAMVAHFVHASEAGKLAVVAKLFDLGDADPIVEQIFGAESLTKTTGTKMRLDPEDLLGETTPFYHLKGSLTTPPCTQRVAWFYTIPRGSVSTEQVSFFTSIFERSHRPLQELNERTVRKSGQ